MKAVSRHLERMVYNEGIMMRSRGGSRTAATSKMERFVIIVNGVQSLAIVTKRSILDVAAVLDLPLRRQKNYQLLFQCFKIIECIKTLG